MAKIKLTDTMVKKLQPDSTKQVLYRDSEVPGLALRITPKGQKTFVFGYSIQGRERRMRIGQFPKPWSVVAARKEAERLRRSVDQGLDPLDQRQAEANTMTLADLWQRFKSDHLPHVSEKHASEQDRYWTNHILPKLGKKPLPKLKSMDVDDLHRGISISAPVLANRAIASLKKALSFAKRHEWVEKNVAEGARSNSEQGRERYLTKDELSRLADALARMPNRQAAKAIQLLLITGARRSEVLGAKWDEFDLVNAYWKKPASRVKRRRDTTIPLSPGAVALLNEMHSKRSSEYLFPSKASGPIKDINKPWKWLVKEADLKDFRMHDLRHTHASILVSDGQTLEVIGRLLGHTQAQTTARYAHLMDDPLRKALVGIDETLNTSSGKSKS